MKQNEIGYDKTSNIQQSNCEKILTEKSPWVSMWQNIDKILTDKLKYENWQNMS